MSLLLQLVVLCPGSTLHLEKVPEHDASILGQDTLGVELNTLNHEFLVSYTHDDLLDV